MHPKLAALLPLIPDRVARVHPGSAFVMPQAAASCAHPDRLAFVAERLHWLSPLDRLSKDEQRALGLLVSNGRPVAEADEMETEAESEIGEEADLEVMPEYAESERQGSAGTLVAP
jgi:hypothetical protein